MNQKYINENNTRLILSKVTILRSYIISTKPFLNILIKFQTDTKTITPKKESNIFACILGSF